MIQWLTIGHSRQMLRFVTLLAVVLTVIAVINSEAAGVLLTMAAAILAFSLMRGMMAGDIREARWALLFQLPGHPAAYYARRLAAVLVLGMVVLLVVAATAFARAEGVERAVIFGAAAASLLTFAYLSLLVFAVSSLVRQAETELSLLYLGLTAYQEILFNAMGLPAGVRTAASMLLFPFNAIFSYMRLWAGATAEILPHYLPQLLLFPVVCLIIATYRLKVLNRGE